MKNSIKYFATLFATLAIATGCNVADTNEDDTVEGKEKIVFISNTAESSSLYIANTDGTNMQRIPGDNAFGSSVSLSSDGQKLLVVQEGQIWTMKIDGSNAQQITQQGEYDDPSFSYDGNKIVYSLAGDIYSMNVDGTEPTNMTNTDNVIEYAPKWSPDGSKIAFTHRSEGDSEIYIMDLATREQTPITNNEVDDDYADWSPDGTELVHVRTDDAGDVRLYISRVSEPNSTELPGLAAGKIDLEARPCWGGDDYIYFTSIAQTDTGGTPKSRAQDYNSSRSNNSSSGISDIITDGDTRRITCSKELDKSSTN